MIRIIQDVFKANETAIKWSTVTAYVTTLAKVSPWFLEEGVLNISQWEHDKEDLNKAQKQSPLPRGTFPMWQFIKKCLTSKKGKIKKKKKKGNMCLEEIKEQLSVTSQKEEEEEEGLLRRN